MQTFFAKTEKRMLLLKYAATDDHKKDPPYQRRSQLDYEAIILLEMEPDLVPVRTYMPF